MSRGERAQDVERIPLVDVLVTEDGEAVIRVRGSIDASTGPSLRQKLVELVNGTASPNGPVCLDLTDVDFVDSVGLSALVATHEAAKAAGARFELANVAATCRRVLEITRLDEILVIRP